MTDNADTTAVEQLREAAAQIDLDGATRQRLRLQLQQDMRATPRTPARRRRMPRIAFGAALAGAAALVLVVALSPLDQSSSSGGRSASSPAQLALLQAADAAGAQAWRPLSGDTYFHVYTTSYTPHIELDPDAPTIQPSPGADPISIEPWNEANGGLSGVGSNESWTRANGSGLSLFIDGGDPTGINKPTYYRDSKTGEIRGIGAKQLPPDTNVDASLAAARSVSVSARPADAPSWQRVWGRMGDSFEKTFDRQDAPSQEQWNTKAQHTLEAQVATLNESGVDLETVIDQLITESLSAGAGQESFRVPIGVFGRTAESIKQEDGIFLVLGLLGRAPLSPDARRGLFGWIAEQPGAQVKRDVRDELGRSGTRVTFETTFDKQVDATTIDRDKLVQMALDAGARDAAKIQTSAVWKVPAHRQYRRWIASFIFNEATGELLEMHGGMVAHATGPSTNLPEVYRYPNKLVVRTLSATTTQASGTSGTLFRARGPVQEIKPMSPICASVPKVCEPVVPIG